jgi:hypothetical protein
MKPWDLVGALVLVAWWAFFRKKYDWKAVVLFYFGGVLAADLLCAGLILVAPGRALPFVLNVPTIMMPLAGVACLLYGVRTNRLCNVSRLLRSKATDQHIEEAYSQAQRGELIDGDQARREIQSMKNTRRQER